MSEERTLKVARNTRAGIIRTLAGGVVSLAIVPLALRALGTEGYGTLQLLMSLGTLVLMSDIGLGLALFTRVGQLAGAGKPDEIRHTVGGALVVISVVTTLLAACAIAALMIFDVPGFLKTQPALRAQVQHGLYLILAAFVVRMPLSVFSSTHGGLQIGDRLVAWNAGGTLAASVAMVAAAILTGRVDVALGAQVALSLTGAIGAVVLGCRLAPVSRPAFRWSDLTRGWELLRSGVFYYLLQVEETIISGLDNVVIARVISVEAVAVYSVANRIISLAYSLVFALGGSFWGGVSQAIGNGDIPWIRTEAVRLRRLGSLWMAIFSGGFVAVGVPAIALWTGNRLRVDPVLLVALGVYFGFLGHTMIDKSILNGAGRIRQQIVTVGLDAAANLAFSVWLAHRIGYVGVGLGTLIGYSICSLVPLQYFSWKLVTEGPRPPFWTRGLSTMVLSVGGGCVIGWALTHAERLGRLGAVAVGGCASLALTLTLIRILVGREGIGALRASLRGSRGARPAQTETG